METVEKVLLAKRSDGKFLKLTESRNTTGYNFVDKPELAKRIHLYDPSDEDYLNPEPAAYYFENSFRAREYWTKDCVMVPYEITTKITAKELI